MALIIRYTNTAYRSTQTIQLQYKAQHKGILVIPAQEVKWFVAPLEYPTKNNKIRKNITNINLQDSNNTKNIAYYKNTKLEFSSWSDFGVFATFDYINKIL